ncbi:uncharacterized protein LOC120090698 [Benincasa hispida]|uniref:uncharacterized protein LOC120090698 n=1 Tax=Benincasa hispida TaxID=102211 RepID=UPI0019016068|nr:uncharacterized protein LOC120090698 [Benincasa hispida]
MRTVKYIQLHFSLWIVKREKLGHGFFGHVKEAVGAISELVIVSDRKASISKAISKVFPFAFHCFYIHHISLNLLKHFGKKSPLPDFFLVAKSPREITFQVHWAEIIPIRGMGQYLEEIGFEKWAREFQCGRRFNQMTTNATKSLNVVLKDARTLPITKFLDHIRGLLQDWFHPRTYTSSRQTMLSDYAETKMTTKRHFVRPIDQHIFKVVGIHLSGVVDLNARMCSCKDFDYYDMPCSHAIAAVRYRNIDPCTLCSPYYNIQAIYGSYGEPIFPLGSISEGPQGDDYEDIQILSPIRVAQVGLH